MVTDGVSFTVMLRDGDQADAVVEAIRSVLFSEDSRLRFGIHTVYVHALDRPDDVADL